MTPRQKTQKSGSKARGQGLAQTCPQPKAKAEESAPKTPASRASKRGKAPEERRPRAKAEPSRPKDEPSPARVVCGERPLRRHAPDRRAR